MTEEVRRYRALWRQAEDDKAILRQERDEARQALDEQSALSGARAKAWDAMKTERDEALAKLKPLKVIHENEEVPFSNMEEAGCIIAGLLENRDEARAQLQSALRHREAIRKAIEERDEARAQLQSAQFCFQESDEELRQALRERDEAREALLKADDVLEARRERDKARAKLPPGEWVSYEDHCRVAEKLQNERDEAQAAYEEARKQSEYWRGKLQAAERERDEARREVELITQTRLRHREAIRKAIEERDEARAVAEQKVWSLCRTLYPANQAKLEEELSELPWRRVAKTGK